MMVKNSENYEMLFIKERKKGIKRKRKRGIERELKKNKGVHCE